MCEADLQQLAQDHLLRELTVMDSPSGPVMSIKGKSTLLFASNDYLGLANHPVLKQAAQNTIEQFGVGCRSFPVNFRHSDSPSRP